MHLSIRTISLASLLFAMLAWSLTAPASAAPLTWTNPTAVSIASPAVSLTVASGSVADAFVVNATSVVIGLSSSTGGSFTLTSTSTDLSLSASAGGGTDPTSCTSGTASTTISQSSGSASYTITPTGSPCSGGSGGGSNNTSSSGPIVGVASAYGAPNYETASNSAPSATTPSSSLAATIASLQAELQSLLAEAKERGMASPGALSSGSSAAQPAVSFSRNLSLWSQGADVEALQQFLVNQDAGPAAQKLAAHGTTHVFGYLTLAALKEYQGSVGLPQRDFSALPREKIAMVQAQ